MSATETGQQQTLTVTGGDEQTFRLVPAGTDVDAAPGEVTAESGTTPAQQPVHGKTLPKVLVLPALLGGVLALVGAVQGGLGWWAAAGGAGLVGAPAAVVAARRIAKRKAEKKPGLERALGTGPARGRSGSVRNGLGLSRFGGPGKSGRGGPGPGRSGAGSPRSGGLLARIGKGLGKGRSATGAGIGGGPKAGAGGPRSGGLLARIGKGLGKGRSATGAGIGGGPKAGAGGPRSAGRLARLLGRGRTGGGWAGLLGRSRGGAGGVAGSRSGAGSRSAGRSGHGGGSAARPGLFRRAAARVRHPFCGWRATQKAQGGAQPASGAAGQGGAGGVHVVPPTRRQRMWQRLRKVRPAFNRGVSRLTRWAGRTFVQRPLLFGAQVAGSAKRRTRRGWRALRTGPKTAAAAASGFVAAPFRAACHRMRAAHRALTGDGLGTSLSRAGGVMAGGAGRAARWLGGHGLNRVRAAGAKRSTPAWRLLGLDALFSWLAGFGGTSATPASPAPAAPPMTPTPPIPTAVSFRKFPAQPRRTVSAPRTAPAVVIPNGGSAMTHPAINQAAEAGAAIGAYDFQNLVQVRNFTHSTPDALAGMAQGFAAAGQRLSETPATAGVAEMYSQIAAGLSGLASAAGEIGMALEAGNAADFDRIDNPRPGEGMADYNANTGG